MLRLFFFHLFFVLRHVPSLLTSFFCVSSILSLLARTDLTFIQEGNPTFVKSDDADQRDLRLLNVQKMRLLAVVLRDVQQYQQVAFRFVAVPIIRTYLVGVQPYRVQVLDEYSRRWEPPEKR